MTAADRLPPAVRLRGVVSTAGGRRILDDITADFSTGRVTGVLGENGAGKSTLLGLLVGIRPLTGGGGDILGEALPIRRPATRRRIGVVLQETALYNELTVRENLRFSAAMFGIGSPSRIEATMRLLGIAERADARVGTLSGGLRRRVAIARALIHEPELLVIDEPTLGVDVETRNAIWAHLRLLRARGTTVVVATNHMDEVEALCDDVIVLREGRLMRQGRPAALAAQVGRAVDVDCDAATVERLQMELGTSSGVLGLQSAPSGAVVAVREQEVAAVMRAALGVPGVLGVRARAPDLAEVLRAVGQQS